MDSKIFFLVNIFYNFIELVFFGIGFKKFFFKGKVCSVERLNSRERECRERKGSLVGWGRGIWRGRS